MAEPDASGFSSLAESIGNASPAVMLAMFVLALVRRWFVLPRELDQAYKRIIELEKERNEYKAMLFRAIDLSERITSTVEERARE